MSTCKYCDSRLSIDGNVMKRLKEEQIEKHACLACLSFFKIVEILLIDPYSYFICNGKIYEINIFLDKSGKKVYIRFKDGKVIEDYVDRLEPVKFNVIPKNLMAMLPDNCIIEGLPPKTIRLPRLKKENDNYKIHVGHPL